MCAKTYISTLDNCGEQKSISALHWSGSRGYRSRNPQWVLPPSAQNRRLRRSWEQTPNSIVKKLEKKNYLVFKCPVFVFFCPFVSVLTSVLDRQKWILILMSQPRYGLVFCDAFLLTTHVKSAYLSYHRLRISSGQISEKTHFFSLKVLTCKSKILSIVLMPHNWLIVKNCINGKVYRGS